MTKTTMDLTELLQKHDQGDLNGNENSHPHKSWQLQLTAQQPATTGAGTAARLRASMSMIGAKLFMQSIPATTQTRNEKLSSGCGGNWLRLVSCTPMTIFI